MHPPHSGGLGLCKRIYSKKLDFNMPAAENSEAGRVWLALDAETQRCVPWCGGCFAPFLDA